MFKEEMSMLKDYQEDIKHRSRNSRINGENSTSTVSQTAMTTKAG